MVENCTVHELCESDYIGEPSIWTMIALKIDTLHDETKLWTLYNDHRTEHTKHSYVYLSLFMVIQQG